MLKDVVITTHTVKAGGTEFVVHGLTIIDMAFLVKEYREPIEALMESRLEVDSIADKYPEFGAKVIAMCAGEPEHWEKLLKLPFTDQLLIFEKCWDLTVPDYNALGKLIDRIKGIIPRSQEKVAQE